MSTSKPCLGLVVNMKMMGWGYPTLLYLITYWKIHHWGRVLGGYSEFATQNSSRMG